MLGQDVVALLREHGQDVEVSARRDLDVTDAAACIAAVRGFDVVVNCAAWTAVDDAEAQEGEAFAANALGPANLARAASAAGARLVHVSTDYVFDGEASAPYAADAPIAPRSAYGRTKAAGEWAVRAYDVHGRHLVLRTAWLYGAGGASFPRTIVRLARERGGVAVVTDQVGQPTWTRDVADLVWRTVAADVPGGTFHATSGGVASWFDFAQEAVAAAGLARSVVGTTTSESFVRPAPRPSYSVLGHDELVTAGIAPIGDWRDRWAAACASDGFAAAVLGA